MWGSRGLSAEQRGLKEGYRSGLEEKVSAQLQQLGVDFTYEKGVLKYTPTAKATRYTPDFILPNGIIIETKGRFVSKDRTKHKDIKSQYPQLDIRFVFSNPNQKIGKRSKTTYAMWCDQFNFLYAGKEIPQEWIREPLKGARIEAIKNFLEFKGDK